MCNLYSLTVWNSSLYVFVIIITLYFIFIRPVLLSGVDFLTSPPCLVPSTLSPAQPSYLAPAHISSGLSQLPFVPSFLMCLPDYHQCPSDIFNRSFARFGNIHSEPSGADQNLDWLLSGLQSLKALNLDLQRKASEVGWVPDRRITVNQM